jgi:hypothetical protein
VSASGAVVVGSYIEPSGFYWMPTTSDIFLGGKGAAAVSRDGHTIVGTAADSAGREQAAIWQRASEWRLLGSIAPNASTCDSLLSSEDNGDFCDPFGFCQSSLQQIETAAASSSVFDVARTSLDAVLIHLVDVDHNTAHETFTSIASGFALADFGGCTALTIRGRGRATCPSVSRVYTP